VKIADHQDASTTKSPAAEETSRRHVPASVLQNNVDQSPRVLAQRRAISALFSGTTSSSAPVLQRVVYKKFKSHGDLDGEFLGDPATFHLHSVGGTIHYKYGKHHKTFIADGKGWRREALTRAIEECEARAAETEDATDAKRIVLEKMRAELSDLPEEATPEVIPTRKDDSGSKGPPKRTGPAKKNKYANKEEVVGSELDAYL